jgi:trk system potassium uptake protein TrkH
VLSGLSPVDAMFEAMSGLTTTGATILTDFSRYPEAFYLWRAMTQWFGGLGVIALFVVVLPRLGIAGRQMFFAEASGASSEAISPHIRDSASRLWLLYSGLTGALAGALIVAGMTPLDAVLHSLTTLSAGGFSPKAESIAAYHSASIEWVLIPFMFIAGTSFTLQYKFLTSRKLRVLRDAEWLFYGAVTVVASIGLALLLAGGWPSEAHIRAAAFQAASLISSTGFASTDYNLWADSARALLIVVMLLGGCAGSAAGGPKAIRYLLVFRHVWREITGVLHPRAVVPVRYGGAPVPEAIMRAVFMLVVAYLGCNLVMGLALVVLGADLVTGFSAALACLGNIGPAFGPAGPMGHFAGFDALSKSLLVVAMWIGRLEIVTVLALLHPHVWRALRWSDR